MKCKDPQQTKKAMKDAMISLLLEKKFEEISIKDITDKAEVHRSTFYAYYTCKGDVRISSILFPFSSLRRRRTSSHPSPNSSN